MYNEDNKYSEEKVFTNNFTESMIQLISKKTILQIAHFFNTIDKYKHVQNTIKFTNYNKFAFEQNKLQIVSNYISIFAVIGCFLYLLYHLTFQLGRRLQQLLHIYFFLKFVLINSSNICGANVFVYNNKLQQLLHT